MHKIILTKVFRKNFYILIVILFISSKSTLSNSIENKQIKHDSIPFNLNIIEFEGSIKTDESSFKLTATKGSDLFTDTKGKIHGDNAPRVLFEPKGDFIFSTKVSAIFNEAYGGGALIVYIDDKNWGKLLFEKFKSKKSGIATTVNKSSGDDAYHNTTMLNSYYLKIVRRDKTYLFYTSTDGQQWNYTRQFSFNSKKATKIGFLAQSPLAEKLDVVFSDIKYREKTITSLSQGK